MSTFNHPVKRAEMTFGYLHTQIPADLTPDASGSVKLYDVEQMEALLERLDPYFIGMRRSTIDQLGVIRQAIVYTLITRVNYAGVTEYAVYRRGNGSDVNLEGSWSIGFGGHVELDDITEHKDLPGVVDSITTLLASAIRELDEEVEITASGEYLEIGTDCFIDLAGFITDYKPEVAGWVGNTHLGLIGLIQLEAANVDFAILETKYESLGWLTLDELKANHDKLESWSALTVNAL